MNPITDFTKGPALSRLLLFSGPIILGNLFQQMYSIVDSILLGKVVGTHALAAVSAVAPINDLFLSVIIGFSLGASLVLAQAQGSGDRAKIRACVENIALFQLGIGAVCTVGALLFGPFLLTLTHTPPELVNEAALYLRILAPGYFFQCLYQFLADAMRSMGDSRTPFFFIVISTCMNALLVTFFLAFLQLGIAGAGWATFLSELTAAAACLFYSLKKYEVFRLNPLRVRPDGKIFCAIASFGATTAAQQMVGSVGGMLQQTVVNGFGSSAIAAYNSVYRIDNFLLLPCTGLGAAVSTFTAQNLGAGQQKRMKEGFRAAARVTAVFSFVASLLIFFFAKELILIFIRPGETEVISAGIHGLRVLALPFILCNELSLFTSFFKGAGDVAISFHISFVQIILRVIIAFSLASVLGMDAIWLCMLVTWVLSSAFSFWYYRKEKWGRKGLA